MTPDNVESLMAEIAAETPFDFGPLPITEEEARHLMATHFCELDKYLAATGVAVDERLEIMAAIAAHAMVENFLLQFERLRGTESKDEFRRWMQRHGIGS